MMCSVCGTDCGATAGEFCKLAKGRNPINLPADGIPIFDGVVYPQDPQGWQLWRAWTARARRAIRRLFSEVEP